MEQYMARHEVNVTGSLKYLIQLWDCWYSCSNGRQRPALPCSSCH